jgi:hypothetical protein
VPHWRAKAARSSNDLKAAYFALWAVGASVAILIAIAVVFRFAI